jgi:hypothetical protein
MKLKIFASLFMGIVAIAGISSCVKPDNYEGPNASLSGRIIQDGADSTVQTCSGNFSVRLEQLSWDSTPTPQDIPVKYDGTYRNAELFSGHYRVSIHGGAFWPIAPEEMDIAQGSMHDFTLMPYLLISNFTAEMTDSTTLKLHFDLDAPVSGIPKILEIQPYLNTTAIVGPGASIYDFSDLNKVTVNKDWADFSDQDKSRDIVVSNLIPGRIFYVRVGVKFDNDDKSSNLSSIIQITVPGK